MRPLASLDRAPRPRWAFRLLRSLALGLLAVGGFVLALTVAVRWSLP